MTANSRAEKLLFISDLHLEEDRPELTRAFEDFLRSRVPGADALYILGDFFNLWIGDDDDRPLNARVAGALKAVADQGTPVFLMHGNRDFLLGEDFARRAGASLLHEPTLLETAGGQLLLMHGDSLCTLDTGYQAFRRQVRDPAWQQAFLAQSLAERRAFAAQARATSQSMSSNKAEDIMDVSQAAVEAVLREYGVQVLVHGHTHRPGRHGFELDGQACERLVLGDWRPAADYLEITAGVRQLLQFPAD